MMYKTRANGMHRPTKTIALTPIQHIIQFFFHHMHSLEDDIFHAKLRRRGGGALPLFLVILKTASLSSCYLTGICGGLRTLLRFEGFDGWYSGVFVAATAIFDVAVVVGHSRFDVGLLSAENCVSLVGGSQYLVAIYIRVHDEHGAAG